MKISLLLAAVALLGMTLLGCNNANMNGNSNANSNVNIARATPTATATPTPTPRYSEEQAREERARAKEKKETIGQSLEDAWVHAKVVTKLIGEPKTPERKINVDVVDGVVTLRGEVDTAEAKTEAERLAKDTDGVKKVVNQLKVVAAKPANTNKSKTP
jgi:osmotically-inducible protein OsmY